MSRKFKSVFSDKSLDDHVVEQREKDDRYEEGGSYPVYLSIDADCDAEVRFFKEEPLMFWQHRVHDPELHDGAGGARVLSCTRVNTCPLCVAGNKPIFKVAWLVVHVDHLDKDKKVTPKIKMWVQGIRFAELFEKKRSRYKITKENVILERVGKGTQTQYSIERTNQKSSQSYDKDEIVDLEEVFGLDDDRYDAMVRISQGYKKSNDSKSNSNRSRDDDGVPKSRKVKGKSNDEDEDEEDNDDDDDIPF